MARAAVVRQEGPESSGSARVLAFAVDDGVFSLHLDWAEAVYPVESVTVHTVRSKKGGAQDFVIHGTHPAFVVDLRNLFGLSDLQGQTRRAAYVVARCGSYHLALQVDSIEGIQEFDLSAQPAVPSSLMRDGGLCVASLIEHEGRIVAILDPNRLLDGPTRDSLEPALRKARAFLEREERLSQVWAALCRRPTLADLRSYARLCRRNGRSKSAAAARTVLQSLEGGDSTDANRAAQAIVHQCLQAAAQREDGELVVQVPGEEEGRVLMSGGRIVGAQCGAEYASRALRKMLAWQGSECRFVPGQQAERTEEMKDSTIATLIEALATLAGERRGRKGR